MNFPQAIINYSNNEAIRNSLWPSDHWIMPNASRIIYKTKIVGLTVTSPQGHYEWIHDIGDVAGNNWISRPLTADEHLAIFGTTNV